MGTFCKFTQKNWIYVLSPTKNVFQHGSHQAKNFFFNKKGDCEKHNRQKTKHEKKLSMDDFHASVDEFVEGFAFQ